MSEATTTEIDTQATTVRLSELPAIGAAMFGGVFAGLTTQPDGTHCAVVLLADKPDSRMNWGDAMKWAERINAALPARPVAALLFANLRSEFEEAWYWTSESCDFDGSCAWLQYFLYGGQSYSHKSYEGRCRAVRLIQLSS
jgi:hypothetical protein